MVNEVQRNKNIYKCQMQGQIRKITEIKFWILQIYYFF